MAVDILAGLRGTYAQLIPVLEQKRKEKQQARFLEEQRNANKGANVLSAVGAAGGFLYGGPAGAAAGAGLGNLAGRAIYGGQAPSVSEVVGAGANLYGLSTDQTQAQQNAKVNKALTDNAVNELNTADVQAYNEQQAAAQSSQRLQGLMIPGMGQRQELNVAADTLRPQGGQYNVVTGQETPSEDDRLAGLLAPGLSRAPAPPSAEMQQKLAGLAAIRDLQGQDLGRVNPQTVAALVSSFTPKRTAPVTVAPGASMVDPNTGKIIMTAPDREREKKPDLYVVKGKDGTQISAGLEIDAAQETKKENPGSSIYRMAVEPTDRSSTAGTEFERVRPMMESYNAKVAAGEPITAREHSDYALNYSKYSRPEYAQDAAGTRYVVREGLNFKDLGYADPPKMQDVYQREREAPKADPQAGMGDVERVSPEEMNKPKVAQQGIASPDAKQAAAATLAVGKSLDTVFKNLEVFGNAPLSNIHRQVGRWAGQDQPAIEVKNALDSMVNDFAQAAKGTQTEGDVARFKELTGNLSSPVREVVTAARTIARKLAIQSNAAFADAVNENRKPSYAQAEAVRKFSAFEPVRVADQKLYNALPSGTYFVGGKGTPGRKP